MQGTRDWLPLVAMGRTLDSGLEAEYLTWQHRDPGLESFLCEHPYPPVFPGKWLSGVPFLGSYRDSLTITKMHTLHEDQKMPQ